MGIPLALLVALLAFLPGLLCLVTFYAESGTAEVKITPPPLRSTTALAFIGAFALCSHAIWLGVLEINAILPKLISLAPADPYRLIVAGSEITGIERLMGITGALCVCAFGMIIGRGMAKAESISDRRDEWLYGWLAPIVQRAAASNAFINGYALTTNQRDADFLGYEGTITNLILDQDKNIIGATLEDVETFYLRMNKQGTKRVHGGSEIATLVLRKEDFQNIALEVVLDEGVAPC
ncbi:MAG: hypothetical protein AAF683_00010 [Pseudomonadota bacterium]